MMISRIRCALLVVGTGAMFHWPASYASETASQRSVPTSQRGGIMRSDQALSVGSVLFSLLIASLPQEGCRGEDKRSTPTDPPYWEWRPNARVSALALSPNGDTLVVADSAGSLRVWDVRSGKELEKIRRQHAFASVLATSPDGKKLACGDDWGNVDLRDLATMRIEHRLGQPAHNEAITSVVFSNDGSIVGSSSADRAVKVWEVSSQKLLRSFSPSKSVTKAIAFSHDGLLVACGDTDGLVTISDVANGRKRHTLQRHKDGVRALAFSADSSLLLSGGGDQSIIVWSVKDGELVRVLQGGSKGIILVGFSKDARQCLSVSSDGTSKVWDCSNWTVVKEWTCLEGGVSVACSARSAPTFAVGFDAVRLWRRSPMEQKSP
jgi:WD40 repeat protein